MTDRQQDMAPDDGRGSLAPGPDGQGQVLFRRHLRHAPERVWAALSEPAQQAQWVPGVQIDARVGGAVLFDFEEQGRAEGEVLVADAPRVLEHTWLWPDEPPSTVRWELEPDGSGGTHLLLRHRPVRRGPAVDYATGWHVMLDALGMHLSGDGLSGWEPDWPGVSGIYSAATDATTS